MPPRTLRLLVVAGARPNFMKVAPLIHAIQRHNARQSVVSGPSSSVVGPPSSVVGPPSSDNSGLSSVVPPPISYRLVHTGQHYDEKMSEVFFRELGIPKPDINLEVGSGSHAVQTANIMLKFEPVLLNAFQDAPSDSAFQNVSVSAFDSPSSVVSAPSPDATSLSAFQHFSVSAFEKKSSVVSDSSSDATSLSAFQNVSVSAFDPPPSVLRPASSDAISLSAFQHVSVSAFEKKSSLPDWLVVVGDVNSTMACTLVAAKLGIKVAHVEAGLRSFDRTMPEEINRLVTDAIADLLLTPSSDADANLRREGVPDHKIKCVGNIMIDALVTNLPAARRSQVLQKAGVQPGCFVYVTLHRPANVDSQASLRAIITELATLSKRLPVVFPMHPRTRKMMAEYGISLSGSEGFKVIEPVGYHDSLCFTENARLVLTDSGGLQEESTWFRTPCLTLRPNTERPITVTLGSNRLTTVNCLRQDIGSCLSGDGKAGTVPPLWDGHAAERILQAFCCGCTPVTP